jgi:hypothetical protein
MDTNPQSRRPMGIGSVAADGFTPPERANPSRGALVDTSASGRVGALSPPAQPPVEPLTPAGLIQLVGELSLRVMRAHDQR